MVTLGLEIPKSTFARNLGSPRTGVAAGTVQGATDRTSVAANAHRYVDTNGPSKFLPIALHKLTKDGIMLVSHLALLPVSLDNSIPSQDLCRNGTTLLRAKGQ